MNHQDVTIRIGGAAGDGVESSGAGFCKAIGRGGLHVFGLPDYYSRIRGGHNFFSIRISEQPLHSHAESVHMLLALTEETIPRHREHIVPGGMVVYDTDLKVPAEDLAGDDVTFVGLAMSQIAQEKAGTTLARNTVGLGFALGATGYPAEPMESVIRDNFARKGQEVIDGNLAAMEAGYQAGRQYSGDFPYPLRPIPDAPRRMVLNGTDAFSMGALAGGCRFVSGYPMTPGSLALHWMAAHSGRYGVVIKHTEDEIAGITMAIGAAHMGARALVPTSGGGFALMVEALGMAAIAETPVVIYNAQRPGPSTGLPTRQEQADMLFMLYSSQGEFPRFLLAPGNHEEAFVAGWRSFNLAERYQVPVLVLSDHYLAVSVRTVEPEALNFDAVEIDRGALLSEKDLDALQPPYLRYQITESGVSPRALPGHPHAVHVTVSNEHNEFGDISEDADVRVAQNDKRMRKMVGMAGEVAGPVRYGPDEADTTFLCWGSTYGPLREAVDRLNASGQSVNMLHLADLWPLPADALRAAWGQARRVIAVEGNATAQLATLVRSQTSLTVDGTILRYDGRPFTPEYIIRGSGLG